MTKTDKQIAHIWAGKKLRDEAEVGPREGVKTRGGYRHIRGTAG